MKRIVVFLLLALCMPLCTVYAQDCADRIQSAGKMYDKYRKTKDVKQLEAARKVLTNIINTPSNPENCRKAAANMLKSFNTPSSASNTNSSKGNSHYVVHRQQESDFIIGSELIFDAEGGVCSDVRITCSDWFSSVPVKDTSWLSVSEGGSYLVVRCAPNPSREKRDCSIGIICDNGTRMGKVTVQQKPGGTASKSAIQNLETSVKITFEPGKSAPSFENVGNIIKVLEENKDYGLLIEITWCKKSWFKNLFASFLIKSRLKKITDYFVASGVDKSRIQKKITFIDGDTSSMECDCAYAKIVEKAAETKK